MNAGGGFAKNFTGEENRTRNGYADVAYALSQKEPKSDRKSGKDNTYWTGLAYAKNLKSVRQQAAEEIASGINRKVSGSSILNSTEGQDAALKQIDDDTTQDVLYSLVTCVDRVGSTPRFCYNTFGLAFYDFKLSVIAGEGLEYFYLLRASHLNQDLDILLTVEGLPSVYSMVTLSPSSSNIASKYLDISTS